MDTYQKNLRDKWFFYDENVAIFWDGDKFSLIFGTRIEFSFNNLTVRFGEFNRMFCHIFLSIIPLI